ncbi:MAG: ABC transporter ATP-binding protein [Acidobacteriota bacterium]
MTDPTHAARSPEPPGESRPDPQAGHARSPLLRVTGLVRHFPVTRSLFGRPVAWVRAVDGVDLEVAAGETLGLVGESGSGKTTLGRCIVRLIEPTAGAIEFEGEDLLALRGRRLRRFRRRLQFIFQDPYLSLNPRMTAGAIVGEPLAIHRLARGAARRERVAELLSLVGLDPACRDRYPHQFSGGQRQRIGIARALALAPRLIVADEPVSALDVSVQAQVLNLLADLQERLGLAYLLIAHDLSVVEHMCDRVAVMYRGKIVEVAGAAGLYAAPLHPYTRALMESVPVTEPAERSRRNPLAGDPPRAEAPVSGCAFHPRCPLATELCRTTAPALLAYSPGHQASCHRIEQTADGPRLPAAEADAP